MFRHKQVTPKVLVIARAGNAIAIRANRAPILTRLYPPTPNPPHDPATESEAWNNIATEPVTHAMIDYNGTNRLTIMSHLFNCGW